MTMILEPARETPVIHETGVLVIAPAPVVWPRPLPPPAPGQR